MNQKPNPIQYTDPIYPISPVTVHRVLGDSVAIAEDGTIMHRLEKMDALIDAINRLAAALEKSQE